MTINNTTQLMMNQKYAHTLTPDKEFKALQTQEGNSLFFSIDFENIFYITYEIPGDTHGWNRVDLSTPLAAAFGSATVVAKSFDVAQDLLMGCTDIVLVVTVNGTDYLYTSLNNDNSDEGWAGGGIAFTQIPFDDKDTTHNYAGLPIADIYIAQSGVTEFIIADIITNPTLQTVSRYFVDPTKKISGNSTAWNPHDLSGNLQSGKITNCVGRLQCKNKVDGVYTIGSLVNNTEIVYTPIYNDLQRGVAVAPTYITLPPNATPATTFMALSRPDATSPFTDLFIATNGSLYFLTAAQQAVNTAPVLVYSNALLQNVEDLHVNNGNGNVVVWGRNANQQLFYMECPVGSEAITTAWSYPIPILSNVIATDTYVNAQANNLVIFAHQMQASVEVLLQITQDPVTTGWQQRSILLPATHVDEMLEQTMYSTHVTFTDQYNNNQAFTPVSITATSPCSVYIEDVYYKLDTINPVAITTDQTGAITIMQPVDGMGCACYVVATGDTSVEINPMLSIMDPLKKVSDGPSLDITLTAEDGSTSNLLDASVTADDKTSVASCIQNLIGSITTLNIPANGTSLATTPSLSAVAGKRQPRKIFFDETKHKIFGIDLTKGAMRYYEGMEQMSHLGFVLNTDKSITLAKTQNAVGGVGGFDSWIEAKAGDVYNWCKDKVNDVKSWVITIGTDVIDFFVTIGENTFHFIVNCYHDIVNGIHSLVNVLEATWDKVRQWVGFVFAWKDIVATHQVLKNILYTYAEQCVNGIDDAIVDVQNAFGSLEANINGWANMPTIDTTMGSLTATPSGSTGKTDPTSNWGVHHAKSNATNASNNTTLPDQTYSDTMTNIFGDLVTAIETAEGNFETTIGQVKALAADFPKLSTTQVMQQIIAILADSVISECEDIITTLMSIFKELVKGCIDGLDTGIDFPIISAMYKRFSGGDEFSLLDVTCLIVAIPATVIFKAAYDKAPFPAGDANTIALATAPDFASIQKLCAANSSVSASVAAVNGKDGNTQLVGDSGFSELYKNIVFLSDVAAAWGAVALMIFGPLKTKFPESAMISSLAAVNYLPYVAPDITGSLSPLQEKKWYAIMSAVCTGIGVLKLMPDVGSFTKTKSPWYDTWCATVSPWVDFVLNIIWQIPTTGAIFDSANQNLGGLLAFCGGSGFDCSGMLAPIIADDEEPLTWAVAVGFNGVFNLAYGACSVASYFETPPSSN